jgi:hypothetical protein
MNCAPFDLKDYLFGELPEEGRRQVEQHLAVCEPCREEFERLRLTQAALAALRDEEPPRRIAFVSDKVFEPRWWQRLWRSGPQLGFASALALAAAIVAHGYLARPQPAAQPAVSAYNLEERVAEEVARRLPAALEKALAERDARLLRQVADLEARMNFERRADLVAFQEQVNYLKKRLDVATIQFARAEGVREQ